MSFTTEKIESILKEYESKLEHAIASKDTTAIGNIYSKNAVMIHKNNKVFFGPEEIAQGYVPFFSLTLDQFKIEKVGAFEASNGRYLIRTGRFGLIGKTLFDYMQQYERQEDGSYLMIHDEFEWE